MIEVKNLYKSFPTPRGSKAVFSDFSLTIKDGTFLGISGESGAGKSTLLSIITGLQKTSFLFRIRKSLPSGMQILDLSLRNRAFWKT